MTKNTLNEHTTRLDIDTVTSLQTVKYSIKSHLILNATQLGLLVKNIILACII